MKHRFLIAGGVGLVLVICITLIPRPSKQIEFNRIRQTRLSPAISAGIMVIRSDGDLIALAKRDEIQVWEKNEWKRLSSFDVECTADDMAIHGASGQLAVLNYAIDTVFVYELETGEELGRISATGPKAVTYSAHGATLGIICSTKSRDEILISDRDRQEQHTITVGDSNSCAISLSADGAIVGIGTLAGEIMLWNVPKATLLATARSQSIAAVISLVFIDDRIVIAYSDGSIEIRNSPNLELLRYVRCGLGQIRTVALSRDRQFFAVSGRAQSIGLRQQDVEVYHTEEWHRIGTFRATSGRVTHVTFDRANDVITVDSVGTMRQWRSK